MVVRIFNSIAVVTVAAALPGRYAKVYVSLIILVE